MEQATTEKWDKRSCTASAFYSLIDPEDWIMAFMEMAQGSDFVYGFKYDNLKKRITYWNYNKEDKKKSVSIELDTLKNSSITTYDAYTLERMRQDFVKAAEEVALQIQNKFPTCTISVQELAESACIWEGLEAEKFCKGVLLQLSDHNPAATGFFAHLSFLSRSVCYSVKDREIMHTLDYDGLMQGIFEATHSMCLANGGFLMSQNHLFRSVDKVFDFPKNQVESGETLKEIRAFYRKNWKLIENLLENEMEAKDYKRLQGWIRDCRQHIEQAWKHREDVSLWNICGPRLFVFSDAANPSYQHASIALFADILKKDLDFQPPIPRSRAPEREIPMKLILPKRLAEVPKPDLIADWPVSLLGDSAWVWLQALYETWAWPNASSGRIDYPIKQGLTAAEKASLMKRVVRYHQKTTRICQADDRDPFRPVHFLPKDEKARLQNKFKAVIDHLENAYQRQESVTINDIVEPFTKKDNWFCQDLFTYILENPLSFFDFQKVPPNADDSEKPFGAHFTLHEFLFAVEKVGQYMHYNSKKDDAQDYDRFLPWIQEHAEALVNASPALEWEQSNNAWEEDISAVFDKMNFSKWLDLTVSNLENAVISSQGTTCIRDYLASWMDPDIINPQLEDFAKLTITRDSLSPLNDFALEHFGRPVDEMDYWDALRRPSIYLLAALHQRGFFAKLNPQVSAGSSQPPGPKRVTRDLSSWTATDKKTPLRFVSVPTGKPIPPPPPEALITRGRLKCDVPLSEIKAGGFFRFEVVQATAELAYLSGTWPKETEEKYFQFFTQQTVDLRFDFMSKERSHWNRKRHHQSKQEREHAEFLEYQDDLDGLIQNIERGWRDGDPTTIREFCNEFSNFLFFANGLYWRFLEDPPAFVAELPEYSRAWMKPDALNPASVLQSPPPAPQEASEAPTTTELASLRKLFTSGSKPMQVLEKYILSFGECVRYADLQDEIWDGPGNDSKRPHQLAERASSTVKAKINLLGFDLVVHTANGKTVGRKMIRCKVVNSP